VTGGEELLDLKFSAKERSEHEEEDDVNCRYK
jgi:hypothetical protein